jgi:hypothetical protein
MDNKTLSAFSIFAAFTCLFLSVVPQGSAAAVENAASATARGHTRHVANNGIDGPACGTRGAPCRSISQAIANAASGDTIWVGPGRYGDLNDDQDFDDPGDEHLGLAENGLPVSIVSVNKSLMILSTHGAEKTVIQTAPASPVFIPHVVAITASNSTFGLPGKGFTVRFGASTGLFATGVENVRIAGNIALDNFENGLVAFGSGVVLDNKVTGSNIGIMADGRWIVANNVAIGNTVLGFGVSGESVHLRGNVATNNGAGFNVNGQRALVQSNVASGNVGPGADDGFGFRLSVIEVRFVRNTSVGNKGRGVLLRPDGPATAVFSQNNFYGNDVVGNCGFVNQSGATVDASRNYWGSPTGPGPDPADNAGPDSGCDLLGATIVKPFASQPFTVDD